VAARRTAGEPTRGRLIGRDVDLASLRSAWTGTADAGGRGLLVSGAPGIGKSALVATFAADVDGSCVLSRCTPPPAPPLRALSESALGAITGGADHTGISDGIFGAGLRTLLGVGDAADSQHNPLMVGEALLRLLSSCPDAPVLWIVEDLHWADAETLEVLDYVTDHLNEHPVLLLATTRDVAAVDGTRVVGRWAGHPDVGLIGLGRLSDADAALLVDDALGGAAPASFVEHALRIGEGTPLLLQEYTRESVVSKALHMQDAAWRFDEGRAPSIPRTYRDAVERRVRSLPPIPRRNVQLAALVGREIDAVLLQRMGLDSDEAAAVADDAVRAQLAVVDWSDDGRVRFRHALTRDAVAASIAPSVRKDAATNALSALTEQELGDDELEVAAVLAEAAGETSRARKLLVESARRAVRVGATATAISRLDLVDALPIDAEGGLAARELRLEALALAGRAPEALALAPQLLADMRRADDQPGIYRVVLARARAAGSLGRWEDAADHLDDVTADGEVGGAPADVLSFRAIAAIEVGDVAGAEALAQRALEAGADAGVSRCEALEVLGRVARETSYEVAGVHFAAAAKAAEDAGLLLWQARALIEVGLGEATLRGGMSGFTAAYERAVQCGALGVSAMAAYNLANINGFGFRTGDAAMWAERLISTTSTTGAAKLEAMGWAMLGRAHALDGQRAKARLAGDRARTAAPDDCEIDGLAAGLCQGLADLGVGDVESSVPLFARSIERLLEMPVPTATAPWCIAPVVLAVHDHPLAAAAREQLVTPAFLGVPVMQFARFLVDEVIAGRAGDRAALDSARAGFDDLRERHPALADRLSMFLAHLRAVVAIAALEDGWGTPLEDLQGAEQVLDEGGFPKLARWAAGLARDAGAPQRRRGKGRTDVPEVLQPFGVTAREFDVLCLLGDRLTNREIAEQLVVSPSTVKSHVERLLHKTGRRNRVELAELAELVR